MESLSSPGAAPAPAGGEMKRKRTAFDKKEKEIFCTILKNSDGGRIWRIIYEGTTTNQTRHDAWTRVAKLFNESTGKEMNNTQVRAMYVRMKDKIKKKHDHDAIDRDFNKSCAKTGGGRGLTLPQDKDGDAMDELELSELEPTDTNWNTLVRPENRFPLHFPAQAARARSMTPPAASSPIDWHQVEANLSHLLGQFDHNFSFHLVVHKVMGEHLQVHSLLSGTQEQLLSLRNWIPILNTRSLPSL